MATVVVVEMDSEASCSIPNPTSLSPSLSHRFLDSKFYLLVVIGELVTEKHLRRAIANIERDYPLLFPDNASFLINSLPLLTNLAGPFSVLEMIENSSIMIQP
ncbi:hypothetical protein TURU_008666 [Turdus rufiventris]|nr:hypothetical protein TURU_008666 [Turdus rufiventris]